MSKILIADDDQTLGITLESWLTGDHHVVDIAKTGLEALEMLEAFSYDLMIVDWQMPELSGIDMIRRFRNQGGVTPILMLTGKDAVDEKAMGLDAGADDYLTKPFHFKELDARMRALLRRSTQLSGDSLKFRDLTLEPQSRKVLKNGQPVFLQPLEFAVLEFLMRHPGEVFSPERMLQRIWDSETDVSLDALYTCISRMRRKLTAVGDPSIIRTVHGVGYGLAE